MEKKYWVPALDRANDVLKLISHYPTQLKLVDLAKQLGINKSSMFVLLNTMETLDWVVKETDGTYSLGSQLGFFGHSYFKQYNLIDRFKKEASLTKHTIQATIQLAKLERHEVLYLAKEEIPSPVKIASEPGMKLPAHATALGKAMLASLSQVELEKLYPEQQLTPNLTPHTITSKELLYKQLSLTQSQGFAYDLEEAVIGFCCIAAPIKNSEGQVIAALSCSIFKHEWEHKRAFAIEEIKGLAKKLSY